MHNIEPHYNWRHSYITSEDPRSPFYGYQNSEVYFTHQIYDHVIHPQWDDMGSETLFLKILYVNYDDGFAILEFLGEWNDCINNDIMILKRDIIDHLIGEGIQKFILIGENVLNFHASDELYYEEWFEDVEDGWIAMINFRAHVLKEMKRTGIDSYVAEGGELSDISWRKKGPEKLFAQIDELVCRRLGML